MKNLLNPSHFLIFPLQIAALASLFAGSSARADETYDGGTGQWDVGLTSDWNTGTASPTSETWAEGYDPTTQTFTNPGNAADFPAADGTVTVDDSQAGGSVATSELFFAGGDYTLSGDTIYTDGSFGVPLLDDSTGSVTINNNLTLLGTSNNEFFGNEGADGLLTLNGTITYLGRTDLNLNNDGGGKTVLNGTITTTSGTVFTINTNGGSGPVIEFGASSNMSSLGNIGTNSLDVQGGTALLDADTFLGTSTMEFSGPNVANSSIGILTNGAFTGTQNIMDEGQTAAFLGGNATVASGWTGAVYLDNMPSVSTFTLSQVAGGRFTYNGGSGTAGLGIDGANGTYLVTSGDGTVVLAGQNTYFGNNTLAADLTAARTLITNTSGSAFGTNTGVVQLEANKLLGGTGFSSQKIVAMASTSIITAGDPGQANLGIAPTIGALTLNGGLEADNGVTLDFKIDGDNTDPGVNNDVINVTNLTLNGTVQVNFTALGPISTGVFYTLINGSGTWTGNPDFEFSAPAGYVVSSYDFETTDFDALAVEFALAPEPSTYALLGLGLASLVVVGRLRKLRA